MTNIEYFDKTCLRKVLQICNQQIIDNWGSQNYSQIIIVTDIGIGLGEDSIHRLINNKFSGYESIGLPLPFPSKISVMCIGDQNNMDFKIGTNLYQQLLDSTGQNGQLFVPEVSENKLVNEFVVSNMFKHMCEVNYKNFDCFLHIGSFNKMDSPVTIFPEPLPYIKRDIFGNESTLMVSKRLEICGYIKIVDIIEPGGFPACISRHLVLPRVVPSDPTEFDQLETDIRNFNSKNPEEDESMNHDDSKYESACLLLHGALKVESMIALVLLADDWYGFLYSHTVKKKSNLMLSVLPPGTNSVPWLGDLRFLGLYSESNPSEVCGFPLKHTNKKSYSSSSNMSWIHESTLQTDVQKVIRNAKKMPERTNQFYKELNRIKSHAQLIGFNGLIGVLSDVLENETNLLGVNQDVSIQLEHAASELRKNVIEVIKKK